MTSNNPRDVLLKSYSLDGNLPEVVQKKFNNNSNDNYSPFSKNNTPEMKSKMLSKIFDDKRITPIQKEVIAKSFLEGNFTLHNDDSISSEFFSNSTNIINKSKFPIASVSKTTKYNLNINRHHLSKPRFLVLNSESSVLQTITPKQAHKNKIELMRNQLISYNRPVSRSMTASNVFRSEVKSDFHELKKTKINESKMYLYYYFIFYYYYIIILKEWNKKNKRGFKIKSI